MCFGASNFAPRTRRPDADAARNTDVAKSLHQRRRGRSETWRQRLRSRLGRIVHQLRLVRSAERKDDEAETDGYPGNQMRGEPTVQLYGTKTIQALLLTASIVSGLS